jgi:hypothetical protein
VDGGVIGCDLRTDIFGDVGEACVLDIVEMLREASNDILMVRPEVVVQGLLNSRHRVKGGFQSIFVRRRRTNTSRSRLVSKVKDCVKKNSDLTRL